MTFSAIVTQVITLATELQSRRTERRSRQGYEIPIPVGDVDELAESLADAAELRKFLEELPAGAIYMLTVLMYFGRGDFAANELLSRYEQVSDNFNKPQWAINQLIGKVPLPNYLTSGRRLLSEAGIDVDSLISL